jgi:hypothetical protein
MLGSGIPSSKAKSLSDKIASTLTVLIVPLWHEAITPREAAGTRAVVDYPIKEITTAVRTVVIIITTAKAVVTIARTIARAIVETVAIVIATIAELITSPSTRRIAAITTIAVSLTMWEKLTPSRKPILLAIREELK